MKHLSSTLIAGFISFAICCLATADEEEKTEIRKEISVTVEDGKMTIDTGDGPREIDLDELGEQGHIARVMKAVASGNHGDADVQVKGRIVMVDDDGEKHVVELGDGNHDIMVLRTEDDDESGHHKKKSKHHKKIKRRLKLPGGDGNVQMLFEIDGEKIDPHKMGEHFLWMQRAGNDFMPGAFAIGDEDFDFEFIKDSKYMVGIELMPVSDMLRTHLGLDEEAGIGVGGVLDDSPAEAAGLERHDVIVAADGESVSGYASLVEAVEKAGESGESMTLEIVRRGDRSEVQVMPVKRSHGHHGDDDDDDDEDDDDDDDDDDESVDDLRGEIESLREALESLQRELGDRN